LLHATAELIVSSTVDLTDSIQRPNKDYRNSGGFAYVHTCKIRLIDIDASVRKKVSRYYQRDSMTDCVDVGALLVFFRIFHSNVGRSQGTNLGE
jgi:hypothetical protein